MFSSGDIAGALRLFFAIVILTAFAAGALISWLIF
jgi:hypothetical protein